MTSRRQFLGTSSAAVGFALGGRRSPAENAAGQQGTDKLPPTMKIVESMSRQLSEIVSVKDFGAKGDGVTDDTAAIAAACGYAKGVVSLYFPVGTYLFSQNGAYGPFYTSSSTLHLLGAGIGLTVLKNTHATGAGVRFASSYSSIRDLTIDANGGSGVSLTAGGQGFHAENVLIQNQTGTNFALVVNGSTLADFGYIDISDCSNGVQVGPNPTNYVNFRQLTIALTPGVGEICLSMRQGSNIKFFGLYLEDARTNSILISGCAQVDVYSLGSELTASNVLTGAAYYQITRSSAVNFWGGRINHSGTANSTLFKTTGPNVSGFHVHGFEILSIRAGLTLFDLGAIGSTTNCSIRDITTNMTATATGIKNSGAVNGQAIDNWADLNAPCSHVLDATSLRATNVTGNIVLTHRTNQVFINCTGEITGTGAALATQIGDSLLIGGIGLVSSGAADSGGAGFRLLRVAN